MTRIKSTFVSLTTGSGTRVILTDGTQPTQAAVWSKDADRLAAEWVIRIGGEVTVEDYGIERSATTAYQLPMWEFHLTAARLGRNPQVSDGELARFQECRYLKSIDLSRTPVTDAGLGLLASCPALKNLALNGTKVTEVGVNKLGAALPNCRIEWNGGVIEPRDRSDSPVADWLTLFNGKSLKDWEPNPHWVLENGVLVSRVRQPESAMTPPMLITNRKDFRDFHVRLEARINTGGDSGFFFRFGEQGDKAIQAQMSGANFGTGSLLRHVTVLTPSAAKPTAPDTWFTLEVIAQGPRIVVLVDGEMAAIYWDPSGELHAGPLAIESGFPGTEVFIRKVEFKMLDNQATMWPANAPSLAVAPFDAEQAKKHQEGWVKHLGAPVEYTNSLGMKFRLIPPGEFTMESTAEEIEAALVAAGADEFWKEHIRSEAPRHKVILTQAIYLGVHEVTQGQYQQVMGMNPSHFAAAGAGKNDVLGMDTTNHPVEMVRWNDAVEFCVKLSEKENLGPFYSRNGEAVTILASAGYRLPTEAQWEFACRGGTTTQFWTGDTENDLRPVGWFKGNADGRTHRVGELTANPFGVFDIHGNVWAWVQDCWEPSYYRQFQEQPALDPNGPNSDGSTRVIRGGDWIDDASACRASNRHAIVATFRDGRIGFRVALTVDSVRKSLRAAQPADAMP